MVRLSAPCALLALSALPGTLAGPLQLFQDGSNAVIRAGMRNILRLNETTIDRLLANEETPLEPHPYAFDLTDDNYEVVLATGTEDNPFATPLSEDDIWVVTVHGPDAVSKIFLKGMDEVATHNSSKAGGVLPSNMHFARLSYARETILPTRWWLWRTPVIVIGTNRLRELRFLQPGNVRPESETLSELLSKPEVWKTVPVWEGALAPGGSFEERLARLAVHWAKLHKASSKVPKFALLALSGFLMNFVVGWFHKDDAKLQAEFRARIAKEADTAASTTPATATTSATAAAPASKRRTSQRKK
ncbi:uncharacterized protein JCM10292_000136 [Rhodotorula paludigena]|uniref:uncharacterized protein n=1 Tax=Rhodotorula paludigena TaxID=86838 RepID=UPI00316F90DF